MVRKRKEYILLGLQGVLFILFLPDLSILELSLPLLVRQIGLVICILGGFVLLIALLQLNKNLSPFPSPKKDSELVKTGLFKYIRHPIYCGILIGFSGFSLYTSSGFRVIISLCLYILFEIKSHYEEELLVKRYKDYKEYIKRTGRFFPKLK